MLRQMAGKDEVKAEIVGSRGLQLLERVLGVQMESPACMEQALGLLTAVTLRYPEACVAAMQAGLPAAVLQVPPPSPTHHHYQTPCPQPFRLLLHCLSWFQFFLLPSHSARSAWDVEYSCFQVRSACHGRKMVFGSRRSFFSFQSKQIPPIAHLSQAIASCLAVLAESQQVPKLLASCPDFITEILLHVWTLPEINTRLIQAPPIYSTPVLTYGFLSALRSCSVS